jgi:hypothetical protein
LLLYGVSSAGKEVKKIKAIPVTGCGGLRGCEASKFPHLLDTRITDGGEVVSLTRRPAGLNPQKDSRYPFMLDAGGHSAAGRIMSTEKSSDLIGKRTCDLLACRIMPQPTTLPRAPS